VKLRVLDLFSGIGGFSLGLERTGGFETVAFCEIEPFPRKVLAKHWPDVPCYDDVRTLTAERLAANGIAVDVICGGFPCQDLSTAGRGAGLAGERSGLWSEIARLVGELRPSYVIVENVSALLGRGLGTVLGDLAEVGYNAEWHCIPASAVGAPHRRDRIWIIAYPNLHASEQFAALAFNTAAKQSDIGNGENGLVADTTRGRRVQGNKNTRGQHCKCVASIARFTNCGKDVANTTGQRQPRQGQPIQRGSQTPDGEGQANKPLPIRVGGVWPAEPDICRVAHGVPDRSHRLKGLGNAVVPQIPELIGNAILASMKDAA